MNARRVSLLLWRKQRWACAMPAHQETGIHSTDRHHPVVCSMCLKGRCQTAYAGACVYVARLYCSTISAAGTFEGFGSKWLTVDNLLQSSDGVFHEDDVLVVLDAQDIIVNAHDARWVHAYVPMSIRQCVGARGKASGISCAACMFMMPVSTFCMQRCPILCSILHSHMHRVHTLISTQLTTAAGHSRRHCHVVHAWCGVIVHRFVAVCSRSGCEASSNPTRCCLLQKRRAVPRRSVRTTPTTLMHSGRGTTVHAQPTRPAGAVCSTTTATSSHGSRGRWGVHPTMRRRSIYTRAWWSAAYRFV